MRAFATCVAAALLLATAAHATEPAREDRAAFLSLVVNQMPRDEVLAWLRPGNRPGNRNDNRTGNRNDKTSASVVDVLIPLAALEAAGVRAASARTETIRGERYASLASLAGPLRYQLDEKALTLRVEVAVDSLAATVISLRPAAPRELEHQRRDSAFFNYSVAAEDLTHMDGYGELGVRVGRGLFYSSATVSSNGWTPVRGLTNVTLDDRASLRRTIIGDSFTATGPLGGGAFVGGLSITRNFDLDPYYVRAPMLGYSGAALTPSTLEVYVNDQLVKRESIAPGPFQVKDLVVPAGAGTTRYVLRDALGQEQAVSASYLLPQGVLARGVDEYAATFGLKRDAVGTASFDYGELVLLGRYRHGFSDWLTGGARLEAAVDLLSAGGGVTVRTRAGLLDAQLAGSTAPGGTGAAASLNWSYFARRYGFGLRAAAASDRYATLATPTSADRPLLDAGAWGTLAFGRRVSLSAQASVLEMRDSGTSYRVMGALNAQLRPGVSLLVTGSHSRAADGTAPTEIQCALHIALGRTRSATVGVTQTGPSTNGFVDLDQPLPRGPGVGYRVHAEAGRDAPIGNGELQAQTGFGRYSASYDYGPGYFHTRLEASGAIAWVRGAGLFAARPVQDGFAVIQVPGVAGVRGYLNNLEIGRTDGRGNLFVPDVLPGYGNRLAIAQDDVPLDATLDRTERVLAPEYRGAALATFAIKRSRFVRGTLRVARPDGTTTAPAWGELTLASKAAGGASVTSPLGRGGEFELEDVAPGPYEAEAAWSGGRCRMRLDVPAWSGPLADLGHLDCHVAAPNGAHP